MYIYALRPLGSTHNIDLRALLSYRNGGYSSATGLVLFLYRLFSVISIWKVSVKASIESFDFIVVMADPRPQQFIGLFTRSLYVR
ncbi:hypothetical protein L1887_27207 [Cichorium endivia]|nr:hypothetical protein L1887_27207 [Cichorium endivia]